MINSFDIETFIDEKKKIIPYCICFIFKKKEYSFYYDKKKDIILESIDKIFALKLNKKNKNIIYVHNLNFDGLLILNTLSKSTKYNFKSFIKDMSIYSITINFNNISIEFKCSYKILPSSLKKIADSFNLPKKLIFPYKFSSINTLNYVGEVPNLEYFNSKEDYNNFLYLNESFNFKDYSIRYCKRDVLITSLFIENIKNIVKKLDINLENVFSSPSLSLKVFEKKFNFKKVKLRNNNFIDKYIRNSYFGGRCEVYANPLEHEYIYHFDFSGMYSQCMKQKFCFGKYNINTNPKKINNPGFYFIEFISNNDIPILPHHRNNDNKLLFTNGEMKGLYWFEEILLFLEKGGIIKKIHYSIEYENYDYVFNKFVDFFDEIKSMGSEYKSFGKLMINSLYGRLGMNEIETYSLFIENKKLEYYQKKFNVISHVEVNDFCLINMEINNELRKIYKLKTKTKNNISLASAITSKARIKLYNAQQEVIKNKGRILYSDTDSIFASYDRNVLNEKHGEIFWDGTKNDTEIKDAVFVSPKTYGLLYKNNEESIKMKGYNQNKISFNELKFKFYNNDKITINDYFTIQKSQFNLKGLLSTKNFDFYRYDKRVFIDNKKNTKPLIYKNFIYL